MIFVIHFDMIFRHLRDCIAEESNNNKTHTNWAACKSDLQCVDIGRWLLKIGNNANATLSFIALQHSDACRFLRIDTTCCSFVTTATQQQLKYALELHSPNELCCISDRVSKWAHARGCAVTANTNKTSYCMWTVNESDEYVCKFIYLYKYSYQKMLKCMKNSVTVTREHSEIKKKKLGQESSMEIHIFRAVKHALKLDFFSLSFSPVSSSHSVTFSLIQANSSITKYSQMNVTTQKNAGFCINRNCCDFFGLITSQKKYTFFTICYDKQIAIKLNVWFESNKAWFSHLIHLYSGFFLLRGSHNSNCGECMFFFFTPLSLFLPRSPVSPASLLQIKIYMQIALIEIQSMKRCAAAIEA